MIHLADTAAGVVAVSDFGFSLRLNNCATNDPCALCGQRTDPLCGVELFYEPPGGALGLVCGECGRRFVPKLYALCVAARALAGD